MELLQSVLIKTPFALGLIGSGCFLYYHKQFTTLGFIMGWFVVFTTLCEFSGMLLQLAKENNLFVLHIYTLGAFVLCGLFFQILLQKLEWNYFDKRYLFVGALLIILNSLFIQDFTTYNSYSKTASQFILIGLCVLSYALLVLKEYNDRDKEAIKFFIAAILLTCAVSTSLYLFSHQIMILDKATQKAIWMINSVTNVVVQVLYIIGLFKLGNSKKSNQRTKKMEIQDHFLNVKP